MAAIPLTMRTLCENIRNEILNVEVLLREFDYFVLTLSRAMLSTSINNFDVEFSVLEQDVQNPMLMHQLSLRGTGRQMVRLLQTQEVEEPARVVVRCVGRTRAYLRVVTAFPAETTDPYPDIAPDHSVAFVTSLLNITEDALRLIRDLYSFVDEHYPTSMTVALQADRAANWLAELCQYASDWADSISGESQVRMMVSGLFPTEIMPSAIEEVMGWPRIDLT